MRRPSLGRLAQPITPRHLLWTAAWAVAVTVSVALHRFGPARARTDAVGLPATAVVARVIDGDTVELDDGRHLRYLGIDTPELRRRTGQQWTYAPEPLGEEAAEANRRLVEGQRVRLEYDARPYDKYNRLLAYVYVGEQCVNDALVARGLAEVLIIPPNVRHASELEALQRQARRQRVGLWGR